MLSLGSDGAVALEADSRVKMPSSAQTPSGVRMDDAYF
ncbi:hypothetical protein PLANPX_0330 [Lacipirellula parvula]|uniref:Uncharacterized protein n=1 Tax=Lacipirellula parvula TaxID=2650471 RepID=A0A5K7X238_9BACT|nr:hypothetical protein PLANPX_0330 [Lacipirellula parvula]